MTAQPNHSRHDRTHTEGYKPQSAPNALKVLQEKHREVGEKKDPTPEVVTLEGFTMIAVKAVGSMHQFELGKAVRKSWGILQEKLNSNHEWKIDQDTGFVFYNHERMQRPDGQLELRVGVKVHSYDTLPYDVEVVDIPRRKYAKISCFCDGREVMENRYQLLNQWIEKEGFEIDTELGSYTLEPNRLTQFNPFDIPADEIQTFDFDILYPIK
ncbi:GyrI-like domain-containing protein [Caldalkalibacillus mannanilyticus]|uniref:GyrI-like domain-containing protein n=1 Tax=Caldalkalibacillus mannanilyticus TaxID=1418 RepID=UPI000469B75A|nr:GyrI-like domain-containing protein [Caldalkalibacillus mannanilyticus]